MDNKTALEPGDKLFPFHWGINWAFTKYLKLITVYGDFLLTV